MLPPEGPAGHCRHDRAPLRRLGKATRDGTIRYMLLCTECGFAVSTEELRRLRGTGSEAARHATGQWGAGWAARGIGGERSAGADRPD
jgi:hypothetical protein